MLSLFKLRIYIAFWKSVLKRSQRHSPNSWLKRALVHFIVLILSIFGFLLSTHDSETGLNNKTEAFLSVSWTVSNQSFLWTQSVFLSEDHTVWDSTYPIIAHDWGGYNHTMEYYFIVRTDHPRLGTASIVVPDWENLREFGHATGIINTSQNKDEITFNKLRRYAPPIIVATSPSENRDFKKELLFWVSLAGLIVSPINIIVTLFFAWVTLNRNKLDAKLKEAQLEQLTLSNKKLRYEVEEARRARTSPTNIILVN